MSQVQNEQNKKPLAEWNEDISFYANSRIEDVLKKLETSEKGLSQAEAQKRLNANGPNALQNTTITWFDVLKNQIKNPFILIFIVIAGVYFFSQQYIEGIILVVIMVINTAIGFFQEYHSNRAMELLKSYLQSTITVHRDNKDVAIETYKLVPGDVIKLQAGDVIPADCRLIVTENCTIDESMLTGESVPVKKMHEISDTKITAVHDAYTIGFTGTIIVDGDAIAVIFATGQHTQMGAIAQLATHSIVKSNLAKGTTQLAEIVLMLVVASLIIVLGINIFFKSGQLSFLNFLLFAGALAITAIPTALPIVITFCLTQGAMALHKHKMIVKRLSAVEDLGGIEILCCDKTGTLTENVLSVNDVYAPDKEDILLFAALTKSILELAKKNVLNGFDQAVVNALNDEQKQALQQYIIEAELPFTYERYRSVILAQKDKSYALITKGPIEYVLSVCHKLTQKELTAVNSWVQDHEKQGNRVLALAIKKIEHTFNSEDIETYDKEYESVGLISFADPLKSTAEQAIKKAEALGVMIKVLSGDSADVCFAIAQQLGLENKRENVILGADFAKLSEHQKKDVAYHKTIFARVTPQQKYEIITYLQEHYSVGYLGDGINDAPALKSAQVGMVVNTAAGVAREAAEIIMLQKSLLNVLLGIEEGRKIIINTLKYIKVTVSSNVGNFYSLALSSLMINYLPMLPLQLLLLDLVADFPLISISTDAVAKHELQKPLHYSMKDISLVTLIFGLVSSPFDFLVFAFFKSNPATLQTSWFIASALTQLVLIFSLRTKQPFWRAHRPSLFLTALCIISALFVTILPFTAFGQRFFLFARPSMHDMVIIGAIVIAYFVTTETVKLFYYRIQDRK